MAGRIVRNAIRCLLCGDVIESEYTWDFKYCKCGACAVDGGHSYLRRCGYPNVIEDLSVVEYDEEEEGEDGDMV